MNKLKNKIKEFHILIFPPTFWLTLFFVVPLLIVLIYSVSYKQTYGGIDIGFTLEHYKMVFDPIYLGVVLRSFYFAILSTVITVLLAFPVAYYMAFAQQKTKNLLMFLVIVPFWSNLLIRLYSFIIILGDEGIINSLMINLGIISEPVHLLNTSFSVLMGLVYWNLPFMILPIFAALDKMNISLYEASMDLGGNRIITFLKIVLPQSIPGIVAGIVFTFVPTLGNFIVPDILGGANNYIIGNVITSQFLTARNWPLGSAFSAVLIFLIMIFVALYIRFYDPSNSKLNLGE